MQTPKTSTSPAATRPVQPRTYGAPAPARAAGSTPVRTPAAPGSRLDRPRASTARTALGRFGEDAAADWLVQQGYSVVERNWRGVGGELDLITLHDGWWAAVEVKTRSGLGFGDPFEAIGPRKLARLHRLMRQWHAQSGIARRQEPWRVDAVAVLVVPGEAPRFDLLTDVRP